MASRDWFGRAGESSPQEDEERPILLNLEYGNTRSSVYNIMASKSSKDLSNRKFVPVEKSDMPGGSGRVIDREGAFNQSRGRMNIRKVIRQRDLALLYADDLFHTLVDAPTSRCIGLLLLAYITVVFIYAVLYIFYSEVFGCNMDLDGFVDAYFFSLETMATIGFGTSDIFFDDCIGVAIILTSQICVKIIADATIIGVIYSRISRPNKRAATVVFTKHAVIKRIRGKLYFTFRVCELRKHQLVDAHIRLYAIRHEKDCDVGTVTPFRSMSMRLNHPNDELGGMLLMCLPQEVVHELDAWSPLMPPPVWASSSGVYHWHPPALDHARVPAQGALHGSYYDPELYTSYPGIARRSSDEAPGGLFRRDRPRRAGSPSQPSGALAVSHPQRMTRQTSYKGHVLRGGSKSKHHNSMGMYRPAKGDGKDSGARHDKTFNYIDMLRSLGQADEPVTPPRGQHKRVAPNSASSSVLQSTPPRYFSGDSDPDDADDADLESSIGGSSCRSKCSLSPPSLNGRYISRVKSSRTYRQPFSSGARTLLQEPSPSPTKHPSPLRSPSGQTKTTDSPKTEVEHHESDVEREEREMVMRFIADRAIEIVVLVEGNDSTTGGVVQARHSYTGDDILWNTSFVSCVLQDEDTGGAVIDYSLFHHTELTLAQKTNLQSEANVLQQAQQRLPLSDSHTSHNLDRSSSSTAYKHDYQAIGTIDTPFHTQPSHVSEEFAADNYQLSSIV